MSVTAIAVCGSVGAWLIVTVLAHFAPFSFWLHKVDHCHLIPRWNFFAPNPGDRDYHLVVRDRCNDGRLSEWRNVPVYVPRPTRAWLWHPQKRAVKILNDCLQGLRFLYRHEGVPESSLPFSLPYLVLLGMASNVTAERDAVELQFAIIESTGHDATRALTCAFLSQYHRR